jgi:hypothetical protein
MLEGPPLGGAAIVTGTDIVRLSVHPAKWRNGKERMLAEDNER